MVIAEVLELENKNTDSILLHKEGLFLRDYEHSAFLFVQQIKEYKLTKKFYKNVKNVVVYLGFPQNNFANAESICNEQNLIVQKSDNQIKISGFSKIDNLSFTEWKNSIALFSKQTLTNQKNENELINKIRTFSVVSKTPIECQQFLIELQALANG